MKVIHVSASDVLGGAARAAYRIHKGLLMNGINSKMLVQEKKSKEPDIITPYNSYLRKAYAHLRPPANSLVQRLQGTTNPILHSSNILPSGIHKRLNNSDADIVHLHWVNAELISIREISEIKKPIVWTLHDMWLFCGAEHYDDLKNSERYVSGYSKDNRPNGHTGIDIDKWTWERKRKYWENKEFNFVAPSKWLANCLEKSVLFKNERATVIPNGLDTNTFKPTRPQLAREILNLPKDKKIILFGAVSAQTNPVKGYEKIVSVKKMLIKEKKQDDLLFVVFGNDYKYKEEEGGMSTIFMGKINDDVTLSLLYSAADVMLVPSLLEAFGQTASEAMACGTPVVAFDATGLKDIIDHKVNGFLARPYDSYSLLEGIKWVLNNNKNEKLSIDARSATLKKFKISKIAKKYIDIYKKVI